MPHINGHVSLPRVDGHYASYDKDGNYEGMVVRGDAYVAERYDARNQIYVPEPLIIEGHKLEQFKDPRGKLRVAGADLKNCSCDTLDISWLKSASEAYDCSPSISDYIITESPALVIGYPNRNMDGFTMDEMLKWKIPMSRMTYQTFIGKPAHQDHDNQDPTKAKGAIFDAVMVPFMGRPHVKLLKGFDRSKDSKLAKRIEKREIIGHSMGCLVEKTECSLPDCGYISDGRVTCEHVANGEGKGQVIGDYIVWEILRDLYFIEDSAISNNDQANVTSLSSYIHG